MARTNAPAIGLRALGLVKDSTPMVSEAASFLNVARTIVGQPLDHIRQAIDEFGAGLMANVIRSQTSSDSASAQIHRMHSKCMVGFMRLRSQIMQRLQIVA